MLQKPTRRTNNLKVFNALTSYERSNFFYFKWFTFLLKACQRTAHLLTQHIIQNTNTEIR